MDSFKAAICFDAHSAQRGRLTTGRRYPTLPELKAKGGMTERQRKQPFDDGCAMTAVQRRSPNSRTHPESTELLLQTLQRGDERRCRGHVPRGAIQQCCEAIQKLRMMLSMRLRI